MHHRRDHLRLRTAATDSEVWRWGLWQCRKLFVDGVEGVFDMHLVSADEELCNVGFRCAGTAAISCRRY